MSTPSEPPSGTQHSSGKPLPLQLELPRASAATGATETARPRPPAAPGERRRNLLGLLAALAALSALAFFVAAWVLPWYVRRECIEEAAAHGVALSIDDAHLDVGGFRLVGVHVTLADVPGARAQAPEVLVETSGLRPQRMTVQGAELTLDGPWTDVAAAVAKWRASPVGGQAGEWAPTSLVLEASRVLWQHPVGDNARMEAGDLHLQVGWHGRQPEVHARSDRVSIAVPGGQLGPWRVDIDRVPTDSAEVGASAVGSSRFRIALDPALPDACTVLIVGNGEQTTSVDVSVPRSPLARLGLPQDLLGANGKQLQLEVNAHYASFGASRAQASAKGALYGIEVHGLSRPLDVAWEGTASGATATGLDVKAARLAIGPLVGSVTGTLKPFDDAFRLDLAWNAGPVPCRAFEIPLAIGTPFDIAYQLRQLSEAAGVSKLSGQVSARASFAFDTRDLGSARLDFAPEAKCQIAFFGAK